MTCLISLESNDILIVRSMTCLLSDPYLLVEFMLNINVVLSFDSVECVRLLINWYVFLIQKLPKSLSESCGIKPDEEGSAGIRLTAWGSVTTCVYGVDTDGRTHFNSVGWKSFLVGKNLHVGQAILITIRNTHRPGLRMMVVIDII